MDRMNKEGWHIVWCLLCRAELVVRHYIGGGVVCDECGRGGRG